MTTQQDHRKNSYAGECCRCGAHVKSGKGFLVQKVTQAYLDACMFDTQFDVSAHFEESPRWLVICAECAGQRAGDDGPTAGPASDIATVYESKPVLDFTCLGCGSKAAHGYQCRTKRGSIGTRCDKCCGK